MEALTKVLNPIKSAILSTEGNNTNLADCYIQFLKIGIAFEELLSSDYLSFKNFAIEKYNKR